MRITKRLMRFIALLALIIAVPTMIVVPGKARAADPCSVLMCMSGMVGNGVPPGDCQPSIDAYFSIIVFNWKGYDAPATAAKRLASLQSCLGASANEQWVAAIQAAWGDVP